VAVGSIWVNSGTQHTNHCHSVLEQVVCVIVPRLPCIAVAAAAKGRQCQTIL